MTNYSQDRLEYDTIGNVHFKPLKQLDKSTLLINLTQLCLSLALLSPSLFNHSFKVQLISQRFETHNLEDLSWASLLSWTNQTQMFIEPSFPDLSRIDQNIKQNANYLHFRLASYTEYENLQTTPMVQN